jgi:long-chain acyl-CoA synthetase
VSFGELAARGRARADELAARGVGPGQQVVTSDGDVVALLVDLLAADLLGAATVVTDARWPDSVRAAAVQAAASAAAPHGDDVCLVVFTSGSTGTPRPVARTRQSWTFSFPAFSALTGVGDADTVLIPGGLSSSLFLFGALHALTMGAAIHPLPRWSPEAAADACQHCTAVHAVPAMLAALADRLEPARSRLRTAVCGGAHLRQDVDAALRRAGVTVVDYYGAAELSFVAIRRPGAPAGVMRPFPNVEVDIRDGVIWARSPYLALSVERDHAGFATVGDLGVRRDDGTLTVAGRADGVITTGGSTIIPEAVEEVLRHAPNVADVAVVGRAHDTLGEVVVAVVEPGDDGVALHDLRRNLRAWAAEHLTPAERPRVWYAVDRLPRTASGKVARAQVVAGLADGTLSARTLS